MPDSWKRKMTGHEHKNLDPNITLQAMANFFESRRESLEERPKARNPLRDRLRKVLKKILLRMRR